VIRARVGAWVDWRLTGILAAAVACLLVLMGLSVANWVAVSQVHASASIEARASVSYIGLASNGTLSTDSTVRAWINVTVFDPGPRALLFDTVIYKLWIEDLPREAGFAVRIGTDTCIVPCDVSPVRWLFEAYAGSNTSSGVSVPASGNATVPLRLDLTRTSNPAAFVAVQNITDFAVARGGSLASIPWEDFILASLWISGVPPPTSPTAPIYLIVNVSRIVLQWGIDYEHPF
jgi:hypothetical protein